MCVSLCAGHFLNNHNNNDSRSGDAGAAGKAQVAKLEKDVLTLAAEADELRRFTQEYMVKASSDKQNVRLNKLLFLDEDVIFMPLSVSSCVRMLSRVWCKGSNGSLADD